MAFFRTANGSGGGMRVATGTFSTSGVGTEYEINTGLSEVKSISFKINSINNSQTATTYGATVYDTYSTPAQNGYGRLGNTFYAFQVDGFSTGTGASSLSVSNISGGTVKIMGSNVNGGWSNMKGTWAAYGV